MISHFGLLSTGALQNRHVELVTLAPGLCPKCCWLGKFTHTLLEISCFIFILKSLYVQIFRQTKPDCPQNSYIINLDNRPQLVIESKVYYLAIKAGKQD